MNSGVTIYQGMKKTRPAYPHPTTQDAMCIDLTQGHVALIDPEFKFLANNLWCCEANKKSSRTVYARRNAGHGKWVYLHRAVWEMANGPVPDGMEIDHVNRNGLDNRLSNLRVVTGQSNLLNRGLVRGKNSRFRGVRLHRQTNRWTAQICIDYRNIYLGSFDAEEDAARAYDEAVKQYRGVAYPTNASEGLLDAKRTG